MDYDLYFSQEGSRSLMSVLKDFGILMQYTGLKDKNGKEIYEGDVVRINRNHNMFPQVTDFGAPFNVEVKYQYVMFYPLYIVGGDCEIIGSIYENPELLNNY